MSAEGMFGVKVVRLRRHAHDDVRIEADEVSGADQAEVGCAKFGVTDGSMPFRVMSNSNVGSLVPVAVPSALSCCGETTLHE